MSFHFKISEPPDRAIRRICLRHIRAAMTCLRQSQRPPAIHKVRKEIKNLRAVFRLVRGDIGRRDYRKATNALRRAAKRMAAPRDARVMLTQVSQTV